MTVLLFSLRKPFQHTRFAVDQSTLKSVVESHGGSLKSRYDDSIHFESAWWIMGGYRERRVQIMVVGVMAKGSFVGRSAVGCRRERARFDS